MADKRVKIWYDAEGDYLEVIFDQKPGFFRATPSDQVMEKVDDQGNILGPLAKSGCPSGKRTSGGANPARPYSVNGECC